MAQQIINNDDLIELTKILGHESDFQVILSLVANKTAQLFGADLALVLMVNPDTRETVKTIIKDGKYIDQKEYRDIHIQISGWIIKMRKSFLSQDIQSDNRFVKGLFDKVPFKSVAGAPLIIEGLIIGALILLYKDFNDFISHDSIASLENIAAVSVPFLRNAQKIGSYFETSIPKTTLIQKYKNAGLFGKSSKFVEMLCAIEAATKCDVRVLLDGKTGTGKELIANAIHKFSSRANSPFISIDCGAIPNNLLESEFFGHKKGAFTGADTDRQGLFLEASGGTLFMDEINNLPYDMQSKLLRALEEGEVRPLGGNKTLKTNVRIITATSNPLKRLVKDNQFREDLFFRLHVYPIYIPDLSERKEDITVLGNHFLKKYAEQQNKNIKHFHEEVIDFMKQRNWNGNVRELENFIERLMTLTPVTSSMIDAESFPPDLHEELKQFRDKRKFQNQLKSLKKSVQDFESELILQTLIECNWNQSEAARRLETSEKNIRYKMEILNILKPKAE